MVCGATDEVTYEEGQEPVVYRCDLPPHDGQHSCKIELENGIFMRLYWTNEVRKRRRRRKTA